MKPTPEEIASINEEALIADGLGDAIIGYGNKYPKNPVVIYDYDKCVDILITQGMSYHDAVEWMEFNVVCSYMGEGTPIFMRNFEWM